MRDFFPWKRAARAIAGSSEQLSFQLMLLPTISQQSAAANPHPRSARAWLSAFVITAFVWRTLSSQLSTEFWTRQAEKYLEVHVICVCFTCCFLTIFLPFILNGKHFSHYIMHSCFVESLENKLWKKSVRNPKYALHSYVGYIHKFT